MNLVAEAIAPPATNKPATRHTTHRLFLVMVLLL